MGKIRHLKETNKAKTPSTLSAGRRSTQLTNNVKLKEQKTKSSHHFLTDVPLDSVVSIQDSSVWSRNHVPFLMSTALLLYLLAGKTVNVVVFLCLLTVIVTQPTKLTSQA